MCLKYSKRIVLKYEISIRENNDYEIQSEFSEITYEDGSELILMTKVTAILTDEKNQTIIKSVSNYSI